MRPDDSITRFELVPWFHGRVFEMSEGRVKAFPHFIWYQDVGVEEPKNLSMFAGASFDAVVSSNMLHLMDREDVVTALIEWWRVVKQGGHIVLHLPNSLGLKWDTSYEGLLLLLKEQQMGWDLVGYQELDSGKLYAFKKEPRFHREFSWRNTSNLKKCGIVRLGAFGDVIQASSILPWLKEQGYHITFYCSDHGYPVMQHDPHVDRFIIQGRDEVPPDVLGTFWDYERKKYDKWINLSESVEGTLLPPSGRSNFDWPWATRAAYMDMNYLEFTHQLAGVPPPYRAKFYATPEEQRWANIMARRMGRRNILWSLSGSSVHKTWPWLDTIVARVMLELPDTHIVMVGDEMSTVLEAGWQKEKRVHCRSGKWSIRESMAFAEVADLIIGTETGLLNAAGLMPTPKIVTLSHSSEHMLTKHWVNAIALSQPQGKGCPQQPCRRMHLNWDHCMQHDTGASVCQAEISADTLWDAVLSVVGERQAA